MSKYLVLLFLLTVSLVLPAPSAGQEETRLVRQVVLVRHGIRSPTQTSATLHMWSDREWPVWPVERGELTPRGAELVMLQWQQQKIHLERSGLIPSTPDPSSIFVYADKDERTQATAEAILLGLLPRGPLAYTVSRATIDPLFHPVKAGVLHLDKEKATQDILATANGSLPLLEQELSLAIDHIAEVTGQPGPGFCVENHAENDCTLTSIPTSISFGDGDTVTLKGQLGIASSLAEIFLLEYGQWPGKAAGWGQVDKTMLQKILPVHSRIFDVVNRAPSVAKARGSLLLEEMFEALTGQSSNEAINKARLIIFVGHDTNIATTGALLHLDWKLPDYPQNEIPPGSCLVLNLWERGNERLVSAEFVALSMDSLHTDPARAELERITLPMHTLRKVGPDTFLCPLADFATDVRTVLVSRQF